MATTVTRNALTPARQVAPAATVKASPGNWRHPRLAEIEKRRSRTVFGEGNVRQIAYNSLALFTIEIVRAILYHYIRVDFLTLSTKNSYSWIYVVLLVVPWFNIVIALLPLFRPVDDLSDIPLTPSQRKLLGLPSIAKAAAPGAPVVSTPPKYSRTPSMAGTPASMKTGGGGGSSAATATAAAANTGTPAGARTLNNNALPYTASPVVGSPLFQKSKQVAAVNVHSPLGASTMSNRNISFASSISSSAFGSSTSSSVFEGPATPTPGSSKKRSNVSSVALNNKWLFEKGRRSPGASVMQQGL
ncbi:nuclear pore complex component-domain-containing protein [Sordaria brevicollis]|uniref:Nuclear pore complex component-domain-containing protein n=1 Tax=Sordaria brevicollis TaxID=83679 RepID=A0AAE0UGB2_SORBR|nr:nuclear pore complex component-domain-containing protein [Sordaria brevicollis]